MHTLAAGVPLEDVWEFPVRLDPARGQSLAAFERFLMQDIFPRLTRRGPAGWLFRLRGWLGRRFGWDLPKHDNASSTLVAGPTAARPGRPTMGDLVRRILALDDEVLLEVRNRTVHALLHLGVVRDKQWPGRSVVRLAVYARPRGRLGRVYMKAIRPLRHWVVYPTLMRLTARHWPAYAAALEQDGGAATGA